MYNAEILYPIKLNAIIEVIAYADNHIDTFSNYDGDFEPAGLEPFCNDLSATGKYRKIVVTTSHAD